MSFGFRYQFSTKVFAHFVGALAAASLCATGSLAQSWPTGKPITLLVGYPAGGSVDSVARIVAEPLAKRLSTSVIVENIGGAGGTLAGQKAVAAAPDGYTLLVGSGSEVSIARLTNPAVKYNGETDLAHIGLIGITPMVFVAGPKANVKSLEEALAQAKSAPGKAAFASSGIGTPLHLAGEMINLRAGTAFNHVPYRGAAQMTQDVLGGQIEYGVFVLTSAMPHIEAGKMTALGVTTPNKSSAAPKIEPLAVHRDLKGFDLNVWFGLFGPKKLPDDIVKRLNRELNDILKDADVQQKMQRAGIELRPGAADALTAFIRAEQTNVRQAASKVGQIAQ